MHKLYADRDVIQQELTYTRHVEAMTAEGLHRAPEAGPVTVAVERVVGRQLE